MAARLERRMDENEVIEVLRRNMHVQLRKAMCHQRPDTVDEQIRCCDEYERSCLEEEKQSHFKNRRPARISEEEVNYVSKQQYNIPSGQFEYAEQQKPQEFVEAINPKVSRFSLEICWNCKELGHVFTQCDQPQTALFC